MNKIRLILLVPLMLVAIAIGASFWHHYYKGSKIPETDKLHKPVNAVYYWKTVYNPSEHELSFLKKHHVERMYLRMFDVVNGVSQPEPNATIKFSKNVPNDIEIVPAVFITVDAMKEAMDNEIIEDLARKIVDRIDHICSWNNISNWNEIQLDCDWTQDTRAGFFNLCSKVKEYLPKNKLLSSTIRLHQLTQPAPPVDYGVLMVYNTDDFRDPHATNSILNDSTVETYLAQRLPFDLPLDIALPIYQWNLIYNKEGKFERISGQFDCADYEKGETNRFESVPYETLKRTQAILDKYLHLKKGRYSTILYHLDSTNIHNYNNEEFENLYND